MVAQRKDKATFSFMYRTLVEHRPKELRRLVEETKSGKHKNLNTSNRTEPNTLKHTAEVPRIRNLFIGTCLQRQTHWNSGMWPQADIKMFWLYVMEMYVLGLHMPHESEIAPGLEEVTKRATPLPLSLVMESTPSHRGEYNPFKRRFVKECPYDFSKDPDSGVGQKRHWPADKMSIPEWAAKHSTLKPTSEEDTTMTHLKHVETQTKTFVNGQDVNGIDNDNLMQMVINTEKEIERLSEMKTESKVIEAMKKRLQSNIDAVVKIMDGRVPDVAAE